MAVLASQDQDPETGLRPKRGGKLNRSETVTVRFDPRLNYLTELAARSQRRTKSSFIEWAVESALKSVTVPSSGNYVERDRTIDELAAWLWDVDEADRLVSLAFHAPILMTHEEQVLWKLIREHGYLWRGRWVRENGGEEETWNWETTEDRILMDRLREYFEFFKTAAAGDARLSDPDCPVPSWTKTRKRKPDWSVEPETTSSFADDLDEDPPF